MLSRPWRAVAVLGGRYHRGWSRGWLALALLAGSACSPIGLAELVLLRHDFDLTQGLAYGTEPRQRLDLYQPHAGQSGGAPVVIFLYGGRWQHGSRNDYRLLGDALTQRGLVAVIPDYRLYPEVRFPGWVEDAAVVVRWVRDSITQYGGDRARIFVVGHSAGAHTAVLLALDQQYLRRVGVPAATVRGYVSLAGPVATVWTDPDVQALMGPREGWSATYPLEHADGTARPLLLLHGARDETVESSNSVRLATRIRERGGCARVVIYTGLSHVSIAFALAVPALGIAPVMEELVRFVRDPGRDTCQSPR